MALNKPLTGYLIDKQVNGTVNEFERYSRQEIIEGWDQDKLRKANVTVVGNDVLGQYVLIPLVALGIGNLRIIGDTYSEENFLDVNLTGGVSSSLEEILPMINPGVDVMGLHSRIVNQSSLYFLHGSDIVVDTTNDPVSKALIIKHCLADEIPLYSMSCNDSFGRIVRVTDENPMAIMPDLAFLDQGELISMVLGGLVAEEVKKEIMGTNGLEVPLYYNLSDNERFSYVQGKKLGHSYFPGKKALIVGAGALGNFVGLGLAKFGLDTLDIIDDDKIENNNLNRQILYHDSVNKEKARVLADKIKIIGNVSNAEGIVKRFKPRTKFQNEYDIIFDCVDNFETRVVLSDYAVRKGIPLISGGTDFEAGQVAVYVPGKTSSINYQLKLKDSIGETVPIGCIYAPNPSVIMTNQVIGGIMVGESRTVFDSVNYGEPINGVLKYGANLDNRLGVNFISVVEDER